MSRLLLRKIMFTLLALAALMSALAFWFEGGHDLDRLILANVQILMALELWDRTK